MKPKGFTLVELLVVIAIIGLLSTVAVVSMTSSRVKARNIKRIADIKQLATALDLAYDANGGYPDTSASLYGWACVSPDCTGQWDGYTQNATVTAAMIPTYLGAYPTDPENAPRDRGGYLLNSAWPGETSYCGDGFVLSAGPTILYALEPGNSCFGRCHSVSSTYTVCVTALDGRF